MKHTVKRLIMKTKLSWFFILSFLFQSCALADADDDFKQCTLLAEDDFALSECYNSAISAYEKRVMSALNDILNADIEDSYKMDLKNSHRAWINYKEMTSKVIYSAQDGIAASVISSDFILKTTKQHALILEDLKKTLGLL